MRSLITSGASPVLDKKPAPMAIHTLDAKQSWLGYLFVVLVSSLLLLAPLTRQWESGWRDLGFQWLAAHAPLAVPQDVVIVGIDDDDLRSFGVPVAMLHRELGAFLEAMALAKPRAVGLDILLPSTSFDKLQAGLDAALARGIIAARASTSLILGVSTDELGQPRPLHPLFASLAGKERIGYVFLVNDDDAIVRRFDERLGSQGEHVPTLSGQLARALGYAPKPGLVNYAQGAPFRYIPLRQVLAWREKGQAEALQQAFGSKVVLLGSVLAFDDQHRGSVQLSAWSPTTIGSHGVLLHAQLLRNLMSDALVQPLHLAAQFLGLFLFAATWRLRPVPLVWGAGVVLSLALLAGSVWMLRMQLAVPALAWSAALLGGLLARGGFASWQSGKERKLLRNTFGGFVSPAVLDEILSGRLDPKAEGSKREVCVLFSDIRGFTTLSESMPPEQVTSLLNRYFELMAAPVHEHGGMLDKFIGDGIMAVFGAPKESANACADALAAARRMIDQLELFNQVQIERGEPEIKIGVGLHYGPAILGYVGSKERFEYSAIGDTVNAAARIEGMTKEAGVPVLLSAAVFENLPDKSGIIAIGQVQIRGRASMEVYGWKPLEVNR